VTLQIENPRRLDPEGAQRLLDEIMLLIKGKPCFEVLDVLAAATALTFGRSDSGQAYNFFNEQLGVYLIRVAKIVNSNGKPDNQSASA
jgi:hypothetical protein